MDLSGMSFLIVEDHGFQRWLLENMLRSLGAGAIEVAIDGRAALAVLARDPDAVDVVVTDLDMPGMDGMEFIRHLGESGSRVSLIVSSSLDRALIASVETMAAAYGVRLLGAVDKPVTAAKFAEVIGRHGLALHEAPAAGPGPTLQEIEQGLRAGQFEAFFQPKVQLGTRRTVGAEALARWRHPERGIVGPNEFIGALETSGAIDRFTEVILKRALAACRRWQAAGLQASVSVNFSLRSAGDVSLADWLMQLVQFEGLEPRDVVLELTESAQPAHLGKALENLSRLRMRGFGLSIDDYGMGYSSMQQLTRIAFTELKIDRGFVRNATVRQSERAMLESSLEMAAKLGITAVAEGVETAAEWDLLREMGCHAAQGYYIAAPMPAAEFLDWARREVAGVSP